MNNQKESRGLHKKHFGGFGKFTNTSQTYIKLLERPYCLTEFKSLVFNLAK